MGLRVYFHDTVCLRLQPTVSQYCEVKFAMSKTFINSRATVGYLQDKPVSGTQALVECKVCFICKDVLSVIILHIKMALILALTDLLRNMKHISIAYTIVAIANLS